MPFMTGTAPTEDLTGTFREKGYQKLFRAFRRYVTGSPNPGTPTDPGTANTGTGVVQLFDTKPGSAAQTWTFTCTTGGASAVFSVTGSVSGAQSALTINTNYENTHIAVRIEGGGVNFVVGDDFQVVTTASGNTATNDRWVIQASYDYFGLGGVNGAALGTPNHEIILKGIGLAGADAIYVGIRLVDSTGQNLNWEIKGLTGVSGSNTFDNQPGASPSVFTAFWNQSIPFWFVVNGRRFIVVGKVSSTYHSLYAGFILPYATPTEYPYPLMVAGEEDAATIFSNTGANFSFFADPQTNSARLRDNIGTWNAFDNETANGYAVWPHDGFNTARDVLAVLQVLPSGESPVFPCNAVINASGATPFVQNLVGVFDGAFAVSGHNLSSETLLTISSVDYLVVQNIFRVARENFMAIKLA